MNKKLLFFDIDGTLVDAHTHLVPESTKLALKKLKADGHHLCISTGRSIQSVIDGGFDKLIAWDAYLCNNAQAIYDHHFEVMHIAAIPNATVHACLDVAEKQNAPLLIMGKDTLLTKEANAYVHASIDFFKEELPPVRDFDDEPVIMMIAYGAMGYDYHEYREIEGIDVIPGVSSYADIVLKGYSKYIGIQRIQEHFQHKEYYAFGDSLNDIDMLKHAKIGVAMGNAEEEAKQAANFITKDVSQDGIYFACETLTLFK